MRKSFEISVEVRGKTENDIKAILRRFEAKIRNTEIVEQHGAVRIKSLRPLSDVGNEGVKDRVRRFYEKTFG